MPVLFDNGGLSHNAGGGGGGYTEIGDYPTLLKSWHDMADAGTITLSTLDIDQLDDKTGNGYHLTATGTARPSYNATGLNGLGTASYDGANELMTVSYGTGASNTDVTYILVGKVRSLTPSEQVAFRIDGGVHMLFLDRLNARTFFATLDGYTTGAAADTNWHIVAVRGDVTNGLQGYTDGGSVNFSDAYTQKNIDIKLTVGAQSLGNRAAELDFAELGIWTRRLSDAEINDICGGLATKWGLSWTAI